MDDKNFLAEVDALLSRLPSMEVFSRFDGPADMWLGQANAVLKSKLHGGEQAELGSLNHAIERGDYLGTSRPVAIRGLLRLIHMVRHRLLMASGGTGAVVFDKGMHYQYFGLFAESFRLRLTSFLLLIHTLMRMFCPDLLAAQAPT